VSAPVTRCCLHADRPGVASEGDRRYCERCRGGIEAARRAGTPGVASLGCAALYTGGDSWRPIQAPGAAHWLGHELRISVPPGRPACAAGRAARVSELLSGYRELVRELPGAGDLWVDLDGEGCGVVVLARRAAEGVEIAIRGGLVARPQLGMLDFYRDCSGRGRFHRSLALRP
jgi:hypothetical protein